MASSTSGLYYAEEIVESVRLHRLTQETNVINSASRGAITVNLSGATRGRKPEVGFANRISGLIQSRDPDSTSTLTPVRFTGTTQRAVNCFRSAPADYALQDFRDLGLGEENGAALYGTQLADGMLLDIVNTAVSALVGGIGAIGATALHDVSGVGTGGAPFSMAVLEAGKAKMGDARSELATMLIHSVPLSSLYVDSITSEAAAFHVAGTIINEGNVRTMGLTTVNSDAAALIVDESTSTAANNYLTLLLTPGAVTINVLDMNTIVDTVTGAYNATPQNILVRLLHEWQFTVTVKAVSYKSASAANPTNAVLATSSTWEVPGTPTLSVKQGPGVIVKTDEA